MARPARAGSLLDWLHQQCAARGSRALQSARWVAVIGAVLSAVMAVVYTVLMSRARRIEFVTTGNQSYPEAQRLSPRPSGVVLQLLAEFGTCCSRSAWSWSRSARCGSACCRSWLGYAGVVRRCALHPVSTRCARPGDPGLLARRGRSCCCRPLAQRRPAGMGGGHRGAVALSCSGRPIERGPARARTPPARVGPGSARGGGQHDEAPPNPRAAADEAQAAKRER